MSSFNWKKNIEDSVKDGLIITTWATGIFFGLKTVGVKTLKASLNAMECYGYHDTCRYDLWRSLNERLYSLQKTDQRVIQQKIL